MANQTANVILGVDVSKAELVVCDWSTGKLRRVANRAEAMEAWLDEFDGPVRMALEPTSNYHCLVVAAAVGRGHQVYLVNPRQLYHYRVSVGMRHKSDPHDAWLLARFLAHEAGALRAYEPLEERAQRLWTLFQRRGALVKARMQVQQSLSQSGVSCEDLTRGFATTLKQIDRHIEQLLQDLGWWEAYRHCQSVPGVGPVTAAALVASYHRGVFANADAFVAYLGLDIRLRESGRMKGRRTLTKHGNPEVRRVLYCATKAARSHVEFEAYYQRQLAKGLPKIASRVVLARKLVRIAFALLSKNESFQPQLLAA